MARSGLQISSKGTGKNHSTIPVIQTIKKKKNTEWNVVDCGIRKVLHRVAKFMLNGFNRIRKKFNENIKNEKKKPLKKYAKRM